MARLFLQFKDKTLQICPLSEGRMITIGRRPGNDLVIENLAVSGNHACIDCRSTGFHLKDLQSKNGTVVNGQPISSCLLKHKDTVIIGKHRLLVDLLDEIQVDAQDGSPVPKQPAMNRENTMKLETVGDWQPAVEDTIGPELDFPDCDTLYLIEGGEGEFDLSQKSMFCIGRNPDADIVISGFWGLLAGRPSVMITKQAGAYFLRNAGGLIRIKRNGDPVKGAIKLNHQDVVQVGPLKVQLQLKG